MRYELTLERTNGEVVRLIAIGGYGVFSNALEHDVFAAVTHAGATEETFYYYERDLDKSLKGLSVDEYVQRGRKGLLAVVRPAEIFRAVRGLEQALAA